MVRKDHTALMCVDTYTCQYRYISLPLALDHLAAAVKVCSKQSFLMTTELFFCGTRTDRSTSNDRDHQT